jgi:hypothetical protein
MMLDGSATAEVLGAMRKRMFRVRGGSILRSAPDSLSAIYQKSLKSSDLKQPPFVANRKKSA